MRFEYSAYVVVSNRRWWLCIDPEGTCSLQPEANGTAPENAMLCDDRAELLEWLRHVGIKPIDATIVSTAV